ncbi:MAG: Spi family protease inhibitor [Prolixibacteraceae bacterium]|nr:Spi family protease inhibitor [Prolixibacteraceae bacterium]
MKDMNLTRLLTLTLLLLFVLPTYSKKVNKDDVRKVVQKVLTDKNHSSYKIEEIIPSLYKSDTVLYFAILDKGGFLIVSADNTAPPVLGETYYGEYNTAKMPPALHYLIERYQYSINYLKENNIEQTPEIKSQWDNYLGDNSNPKSISITEGILSSVSPLLCTIWGQESGYNYYCPDNSPAG